VDTVSYSEAARFGLRTRSFVRLRYRLTPRRAAFRGDEPTCWGTKSGAPSGRALRVRPLIERAASKAACRPVSGGRGVRLTSPTP